MKRLLLLTLLVFSIMIVFFLSSCKEEATTSISDRISQFKTDLEGDQSNLWVHIHSDNAMKNTLKSTAAWNPPLVFSSASYTFSNVSGNGSTRTATISETPDQGNNGDTLTFTMKEDGEDNWFIMNLDLTGYGNIF